MVSDYVRVLEHTEEEDAEGEPDYDGDGDDDAVSDVLELVSKVAGLTMCRA